jgi:hypothetical protein
VGLSSNFVIGTLEVQAGNVLTVVDAFDNDALGSGPCTEALYVHELQLRSGSTVDLADASLYYVTLVDEGATVSTNGCGVLQCIQFDHGDLDVDGAVTIDDILCALAGFSDFSACPSADVMPCGTGNGVIDLADLTSIMDAFGGTFACPSACVGG